MQTVMYHYVKKGLPNGLNKAVLSFDNFRKQLDFFQEKGQIIHPKDLASSTFEPDENQFLLTFDDGLSDHYELVFPELKARDLTALFFINGQNYVQHRLLNVHRLHYLLATQHGSTFEKYAWQVLEQFTVCNVFKDRFEATAYEGLQQEEIISAIKSRLNFFMPQEEQDRALKIMLQQYNIDEKSVANNYYLSLKEAKIMKEAGMCFGAHGYSHYVLSNMTYEQQKLEVEQSINILKRENLLSPLAFFCYPYGYSQSYNENTLSILNECGIDIAFAVENRRVSKSDWQTKKLSIPRMDCNRFL